MTITMRRAFAALLLAIGLVGLTSVPAFAQSSGGDSAAAAVNTRDGATVFRFAFNVTQALGDTVNSTNAAVAYASCTDCRTVAISFQIVFVIGDPSTFTPTNEAISINYQCNLCDTMAAAYQFVVQASGPVHFTADGRRELEAVMRAIRSLDVNALTDAELRAKLDTYAAEINTILSTQLVAGPPLPDSAGGDTAGSTTTTTTTVGGSMLTSTTQATSTSTTSSSTSSTSTTSTAPTSTSTTAP
jgi:putative peptide zinc metalloprotease protein